MIKIGDKIKALIDYPSGGGVKKNEIGIISYVNSGYIHVNFPSQSPYHIALPFKSTSYCMVSNDIVTLEEAKAKYPIGTTYKCPHNGSIHTITSNCEYKMTSSGPIVYPSNGDVGKYLYVNHMNKWAEIIESSMHSLLEEAKRRYLPGMKCSNYNLGYCYNFTIGDKSEFYKNGSSIIVNKTNSGSYTVYNGVNWAEIIALPETTKSTNMKFKVGDKVRAIDNYYGCIALKYNYVGEVVYVSTDGRSIKLTYISGSSESKHSGSLDVETKHFELYQEPWEKDIESWLPGEEEVYAEFEKYIGVSQSKVIDYHYTYGTSDIPNAVILKSPSIKRKENIHVNHQTGILTNPSKKKNKILVV